MSSTTHTSGLVRQSLPKGLRALIGVVRGLTLLGAFALCVVPVAFWCSPGWVAEDGPALASLHGHPVVIDARARLWGAVASAPGVALGLAALAQLWALFSEYDAGRVFGVAAVRHMGRFAWFMLASALLVPLQRAAIGVALTLGNPAGSAPFPYASPALFSMSIAFAAIWLFSVLDKSKTAQAERAAYPAQQVRAETGIGASKASSH